MIAQEYEFHEIANGYPYATADEFALLKESINTKGQQAPIILFEGKVLDGRNRYKACIGLGIEPITEIFNGTHDEAVNYSHELNSGRRNLDKSQKAMVAAFEIERSKQKEGVSRLTIQQAARIYAISDNYIKRANKILAYNVNIAEQVFNGHDSIGRAEKRIDELKEKEDEANDILHDICRDAVSSEDDELSELYAMLYSMSQKELVKIIVDNYYVKKGN